ncbi:MAG: hypothetical protein AAF600_20420 [Bacteroidota bacterium]
MQENHKIKRFLSEVTDMNKLDEILKIWVTQTMDEELRDELSQTLNDQYGVKRTTGKGLVVRFIRPILVAAASLALLATLYVVYQNSVTANTLAMQHLESQTLKHPGGLKGVAKSDANRTRGILAFNNGNFEKATLQFEKIALPNEEDVHYLGLAYLKNGEYQKAIENLKKSTSEVSRFREEANWFLSLAYLLDDRDKDAIDQLEQIGKGEWRFDEARKLLKKLNN